MFKACQPNSFCECPFSIVCLSVCVEPLTWHDIQKTRLSLITPKLEKADHVYTASKLTNTRSRDQTTVLEPEPIMFNTTPLMSAS